MKNHVVIYPAADDIVDYFELPNSKTIARKDFVIENGRLEFRDYHNSGRKGTTSMIISIRA